MGKMEHKRRIYINKKNPTETNTNKTSIILAKFTSFCNTSSQEKFLVKQNVIIKHACLPYHEN